MATLTEPIAPHRADTPRYYVPRQMFQAGVFVILGVLVLEVLAFEATDRNFISWINFRDTAHSVSLYGVPAIGATLVIICGGIDLSVGTVLGAAALVTAVMIKNPYFQLPVPLGVLAGLGFGALMGFLNGVLIAYGRIAPFIVTLGTMSVAEGIGFSITKFVNQNEPVSLQDLPPRQMWWLDLLGWHIGSGQGWSAAGERSQNGLYVGVFVMLLGALAAAWLLVATRLGRYIHAIGGNEEATRYAGVPVQRVKLWVYTLAGLLAGLGGVLLFGKFRGPDPNLARGWELQIIAAAVVGGVSLSGGRGSPLGAIIGAAIIGVLFKGLTFNGIPDEIARVAIGGAIILAAAADRLILRLSGRRQSG